MSKSQYSRHNKAFLKKLKSLRESRKLRQTDLGDLLGRSQGWVSYVETGATTLNVIELREWVEVLDYNFMEFLQELDEELRWLSSFRLCTLPRKRAGNAVNSRRPPGEK